MRDIKIMTEMLANKIAAGEVIERPVSAIKELVENAIDANASAIEIRIEDSGISNIKVIDNGIGMTRDNLALSIKRHATSKIYNEKEMLKIASLGFRGEALSSMFAVSKFSIISSIDGISGYRLEKTADDYEITPVGANIGTIVEVKQLFYNTPARYSGLTNPIYELSLIISYVEKLALSNPQISFTLSNNDKDIIKTSGDGNIEQLFYEIYGKEVSENLLYKEDFTNNFKVKIHFGSPQISKAKKSFITLVINGRIVKEYQIEQTIINSYKNYLHTNQYPLALVDIKVDYSLLDVNIHPNKQQIKIALIDELLDMLAFNIKAGLKETQFINHQISESYPEVFQNNHSDHMLIEDNQGTNPMRRQVGFDFDTPSVEQESDLNVSIATLPQFEYIGALHQTYLLFQNEEGLFLVDQHAAQERIRYEILLKKFQSHQFTYQKLLIPIVIELSPSDYLLVNKKINDFADLGIIMEDFGLNTIRITEIDLFYMQVKDLKTDIERIIKIISQEQDISFSSYFDATAIMMACKSSIKAKQYVNLEEAQVLIDDLRTCDVPFTCPHGRPIVVNYSTASIEKLFKRVF